MTRTTTAIGYTDNLPASDPASLVEREVELPEPGPHDLVVAVEAVSVNPIDTKVRRAQPSGGFRVLGFDAAGTVAAALADGADEEDLETACAAVAPQPVDQLILQGDLTAIAPGPLVPELARLMHAAADVESRGGATVFRFSRASISRKPERSLNTSTVCTKLPALFSWMRRRCAMKSASSSRKGASAPMVS